MPTYCINTSMVEEGTCFYHFRVVPDQEIRFRTLFTKSACIKGRPGLHHRERAMPFAKEMGCKYKLPFIFMILGGGVRGLRSCGFVLRRA